VQGVKSSLSAVAVESVDADLTHQFLPNSLALQSFTVKL